MNKLKGLSDKNRDLLEQIIGEIKAESYQEGYEAGKLSVVNVEEKTANQKRAEVIEKAKAFLEEHCTDDFHFEVDKENRRILAWKIFFKKVGYDALTGVARCSPKDVFNEWIGKAIALGRALGLDVNEFEQVVQPTEVLVGMVVSYKGYQVTVKPPGAYNYVMTGDCAIDSPLILVHKYQVITDDTEAQYEVIS